MSSETPEDKQYIKEEGVKTLCSCGKPGKSRVDNGLPSGIHCDDCWLKLLISSKSRSW